MRSGSFGSTFSTNGFSLVEALDAVADLLPQRHDEVIVTDPVVAADLHRIGIDDEGVGHHVVGVVDVEYRIARAAQDPEHRNVLAVRRHVDIRDRLAECKVLQRVRLHGGRRGCRERRHQQRD